MTDQIAISSEKNLDFTPEPAWTVTPGEQFGQYWLKQAITEQEDWVDDGHEVSGAEGHRRMVIAQRRDKANAHLLGMAPRLYLALKALYLDIADTGDHVHPETGEEFFTCDQARQVLEEVESPLRNGASAEVSR